MIGTRQQLLEYTRRELIAKSRQSDNYKDKGRENTNRWDRKALQQLRTKVADYGGVDTNLFFKKDILVAAISRKKKIIFPNGDDTIEAGDSIIIVTKNKSIRSIEDIFV